MTTRCLLVTLALLLSTGPGFAKEKARGETATRAEQQEMEREARRACLNGEYDRGVAILSDLFVDTKDSNHIFNQGRCYEQSQRFEEAIGRFREYLRTSNPDRPAAEKHIAECEALLAKKNAPAAPRTAPLGVPETAPATTLPPTPATTAAPVVQAAPAVQDTPSAPAPGSAVSGLRIGGLVAAGIGAAALVTGLVLNLKANSVADSIDPPDHTFDRGKESTRSSYETFSWVGYGVGAAGMVTGAVLYAIGWSRAGDSSLALHPAVAPGLAGATLRSSF